MPKLRSFVFPEIRRLCLRIQNFHSTFRFHEWEQDKKYARIRKMIRDTFRPQILKNTVPCDGAGVGLGDREAPQHGLSLRTGPAC